MNNLRDKVAIVTGGARDIGRETSIKLAKEGASVCINYYDNPEQAEETKSMIEDLGGKAIIVQGDMTKQEDIDKVVNECKKSFGDEIHVLVNIAGGLVGRKMIDELEMDFWNFVITLNLTSVYMVTKAVVPNMPSGSSIINFSSQAAREPCT